MNEYKVQTKTSPNAHDEDESFKAVWMIIKVVLIAAAGALLIYLFQFGQYGLSKKLSEWGNFGSYFGGLVGTIVGFGTFLFVAATFRSQHSQLKLTKKNFEEISNRNEYNDRLSKLQVVRTESFSLLMETDKRLSVLSAGAVPPSLAIPGSFLHGLDISSVGKLILSLGSQEFRFSNSGESFKDEMWLRRELSNFVLELITLAMLVKSLEDESQLGAIFGGMNVFHAGIVAIRGRWCMHALYLYELGLLPVESCRPLQESRWEPSSG